MGGVMSAYTQSKETDFIYDATANLMTERVLRMMYPDEIDSNQFPNIQDNGTFLLPPEFTDASSLYGAPYVLIQKRKTAIKAFVHQKLQDPQAFWMHFCKTLDIEMNPKPMVIIRVDQEGMIHTKCENGDAEIRIEFDESDQEEEDQEEKMPKKKKEKKPAQKNNSIKEWDDIDYDKDDKDDKDTSHEDQAINDLDDDFESDSQLIHREKDFNNGSKNAPKKEKKGKAK
jgi:hypothetical protein